jgi:hypothetical protein
MRNITAILGLCLALATAAEARDNELECQISSIAMFKNGLAVVTRAADVPGPGVYYVTNPPEPVHGTFWIESDAKVEARMTTREVETSVTEAGGPGLQDEWIGASVVLHFRDGNIPPASGTVLERGTAERSWDRNYQQPQYGQQPWHSWRSTGDGSQPHTPAPRYLVLRTDRGRVYVDSSMIAYAEVEGARETVRQARPVLELTVQDGPSPARVTMSYLTKGIAWAPSYRIDISDEEKLTIQQKAVIKNELEDAAGAKIYLISGFPSVTFAHVSSPMSLNTTWASFFQQLSQQARPPSGLAHALTQQLVTTNAYAPAPGVDLSAAPFGEGPDIHYQPIGRRDLKAGDSLAFSVASASASYERIVEWVVPDTRDPDGRYLPEHRRNENPEDYQDSVWDALRFRNPLPFPMTTAAVMIVGDGQFHGQQMCYWTNKGETATVHVTKALSIRTRSVEHEVEGEREVVHPGGRRFQKTQVKGELTVSNHRDETVNLLIRRRFSGDLLEADGAPKCTLLEEGVWSVNKRNELSWTIDLKSGEEMTVTYKYQVLVYY